MTNIKYLLFTIFFNESDRFAIKQALNRRSIDDSDLITEEDKKGASKKSMENAVIKLRCKLISKYI